MAAVTLWGTDTANEAVFSLCSERPWGLISQSVPTEVYLGVGEPIPADGI